LKEYNKKGIYFPFFIDINYFFMLSFINNVKRKEKKMKKYILRNKDEDLIEFSLSEVEIENFVTV
jgi:hypothetical protein